MKQVMAVAITGLIIIGFSGCATTSRERDELTRMRQQVFQLETELQRQKEENQKLQADIVETKSAAETRSVKSAEKKEVLKNKNMSRVATKQIQRALKNAGFYNGKVDGIMGQQTKEAIRAFQKDNSLEPDGVVGNKTWAKLRSHLYKK